MGNAEKVSFFIHECKELDFPIQHPHVNLSEVVFDVQEGTLVYGLAAIKGVGTSAAEAIVRARKEKGDFESFTDFCEKVAGGVNRRVMENLVKVGAFDFFGAHRSCLFVMIEPAIARAQSSANDRALGQGSLFDMLSDEDLADSKLDVPIPDLPEWHEKERLDNEKQLLGYYATGHPLGIYSGIIKKYSSVSLIKLKQETEATGLKFGCMIKSAMFKTSKKSGLPWAILLVEDMEDSIECLCFPDVFARCKDFIKNEAAVFIEGEYQYSEEDDTRKIIVRNVINMTDAVSAYTEEVHIRLYEDRIQSADLDELKEILQKRRTELNDYERQSIVQATLSFFEKSDFDFVYKFSNYLKDSFNASGTVTQLLELIESERFGCMNAENSYLTPEQKKYLVIKVKKLKTRNPVVLCAKNSQGDIAFIETANKYRLNASWDLVSTINEKFGEGAIHLKIDKSVPEIRQRRQYKKQNS